MHSTVNNSPRGLLSRLAMAGGTVVLLGLGACQTTVAPDGTITTIATGTPVVVTTVPDRTLVLTVNFQFDSAYLTPDAAVLLSNVAGAMTDQSMAGTHYDINGHTDIIGGEDYNLKLSIARAEDVRTILESGLAKAGRSDVKFEVHGFGADQNLAPFENKYPEERFYNRTVIIDIVLAK